MPLAKVRVAVPTELAEIYLTGLEDSTSRAGARCELVGPEGTVPNPGKHRDSAGSCWHRSTPPSSSDPTRERARATGKNSREANSPAVEGVFVRPCRIETSLRPEGSENE